MCAPSFRVKNKIISLKFFNYFQVHDYNMLPEVGTLAGMVKTCLQESDEVPRDITTLFDNALFKLDTSTVPKAIK
jgi:intraflagellar transport protein 52